MNTANTAGAIAVDNLGNVYITDNVHYTGVGTGGARDDVIRKIDASTGIISKIAGDGFFTLSAVGGPATGATLGTIIDIQVDGTGNVYLLEQRMGLIWKLYR